MEWVDFTFKIAGYSYRDTENNQIINKGVLYDRCKNDRALMESIINNTCSKYKRENSEYWKDQECFYVWKYNPVSHKPFKFKITGKQKSLFGEDFGKEEADY